MKRANEESETEDLIAPEQSGSKVRKSVRRRLIDSAYELMGKKGIDLSTIAEIISNAGVGVGSFYNHFSSKEELAQAVFSTRTAEYGAVLEQLVRRASNSAAATCFAYRRMIEEAERDKVWAAFIVQLEPKMHMLENVLHKHARVGLSIGVADDSLKIHDIDVGATAIHAIQIAIVKEMLAGNMNRKQAHQSADLALRMLGVSEEEAWRLANLSMPALRREMNVPPV